MSTSEFIIALKAAVSGFTYNISIRENQTVSNRREEILKYILALIYYDIILLYFTDTGISEDQNIMEQSEIIIVIEKLNNIMNTNLYTDFS